MTKPAFNLLGDFGNVNPSSDLYLFLAMLPFHIQIQLHLPIEHSKIFSANQCQSYVTIRDLLIAKNISDIYKDHLSYNLVQALLKEECDIEQAASLLITYVFMTKCKKVQQELSLQTDWENVTTIHLDNNGDISFVTLAALEYENPILSDHPPITLRGSKMRRSVLPEGLCALKRKDADVNIYLPLLKTWNEHSRMGSKKYEATLFPIVGAFDTATAFFAAKQGRRLMTVPLYVPNELRGNFNNMTRAHGNLFKGYFQIIAHDYFHGYSSMQASAQKKLKVDFAEKTYILARTNFQDREPLHQMLHVVLDEGVDFTLREHFQIFTKSFTTTTQIALLYFLIEHPDFESAAYVHGSPVYDTALFKQQFITTVETIIKKSQPLVDCSKLFGDLHDYQGTDKYRIYQCLHDYLLTPNDPLAKASFMEIANIREKSSQSGCACGLTSIFAGTFFANQPSVKVHQAMERIFDAIENPVPQLISVLPAMQVSQN